MSFESIPRHVSDSIEHDRRRHIRIKGPFDAWRVDVIETPNEYLIHADLPGVSKSDLSVTLENGHVIIKGQRPTDALAEGTSYLVNERAYGAFTRTFILPDHAEASHIEADFKQGVLTVKVPKAEKAKARSIAIQGE